MRNSRENITDQLYRPYSSGLAARSRNIVFSMIVGFRFFGSFGTSITYIQAYSSGHEYIYSNIILNSDTFRNEMKIVFKKKGLFVLVYGPNSIENSSDFEGKCNQYDFNVFTKLNAGYNNNINLLEQSPDEHFNTWLRYQHTKNYYRGSFSYIVE